MIDKAGCRPGLTLQAEHPVILLFLFFFDYLNKPNHSLLSLMFYVPPSLPCVCKTCAKTQVFHISCLISYLIQTPLFIFHSNVDGCLSCSAFWYSAAGTLAHDPKPECNEF